MPRRNTLLAALLVGAVVACSAELLEPTSQALAGRWRRGPEPQSPAGQFLKTVDFTEDGHYTVTTEFRGVYPQLSAEAVGSTTSTYGSYVLTGDVLRFPQDSVRTWDDLTGTSFHAGSGGIYFDEGPPTDPIVELTPTRLTLRYSVNPGDGYVPVTETFDR